VSIAPPPVPAAPAPAPAATPATALPLYRCDQGIEFSARFGEGTAELEIAGRGRELLLRDAGGLTPQQTVYSSTRLKAQFGLEPEGRGAKLNFVSPPIEVNCTKS